MVNWPFGHCTFPISKAAGYKIDVLEYHDAKGEFHKCRKRKVSTNHRTLENDVRNRGKHIAGWAFDPNWVKEGLQMASLVFDASKPTECPLQLL